MKNKLIYIYLGAGIISLFVCVQEGGEIFKNPDLIWGVNYRETTPELFAPGIVTNGYQTRDVAITPQGDEIFFGVRSSRYYSIMVTRRVENGWTKPEVLEHMDNPAYMNIEPALSYDGNRLFFLSDRPDPELGIEDRQQDIWVMDREDKGWSEPYNLGPPVNTEDPEFYPSLTRDGTIYLTRRQELTGGKYLSVGNGRGEYQEPEKLPEQVNCGLNHYNAFVSYDESYIIVPTVGREDSFGGTDYYIVFRDNDDRWSEPINMGNRVNTPDTYEYSAYVTRDGKILFFMSRRFEDNPEKLTYDYLVSQHNKPESGNPSIYWMNAEFIDSLRTTSVFR